MLFNKVLALLVVIITLPILIFTVIGILVSDFGPIIYKAKRAGKNGKEFFVLKFRSMKLNSANSSKITSSNDNRIFAFGKIIRLLKIDELPQLFNIMKGDMNIIGPRPEDIDIVKKYYDEVMYESLSVNPGLASPGSIYNYTHLENKINDLNPEEDYIKNILPLKVRLDVVYVREKNFIYDVKLVLKTLQIILLKISGQKKFNLPKEYFKALKI